MKSDLYLYNSLTGKKEKFEPILPGFVGMYVCGPTVYSDVHLGNIRTFVGFDTIYRYLLFKGYKVRYVRNITDVGHLLDDGEDRMSKGARLEKLEPMEVAQKYANGFQDMMNLFHTLRPSIEPKASGHIIEQIEMVQAILDNGYAYEANGSVYFDVPKYAEQTGAYGNLSGRKLDDLLTETREELKNQGDKKHPADFAIWMKASDDHIMRWNSPWSVGFPGWHLECSVMSTKYLGEQFDIHGGGNDLKFPHHENEIAQNTGACGKNPVKYWLHTNMLILNGAKMSKSDGNTVTPDELLEGTSPLFSKSYNSAILRFFMMQSHYRSTLDLTDRGLLAAEKGYYRMMETMRYLDTIHSTTNEQQKLDEEIETLISTLYKHMDDDFNTPRTLATLFDMVSVFAKLKNGQISSDQVSIAVLEKAKSTFTSFITDVLGLWDVSGNRKEAGENTVDGLMELVIDIRQDSRENKNWAMADLIRDKLNALNIELKDGKDGTLWVKK
jgi:cysteinyl-tRNA synthetase